MRRSKSAPHDPQRFVTLAKQTEDCILLTLSEPDFGISDVVRTNVPKSLETGRDGLQALVGEDDAGGVVGGVEDDGFGFLIHQGGEFAAVDLVGILGGVQENGDCAGEADNVTAWSMRGPAPPSPPPSPSVMMEGGHATCHHFEGGREVVRLQTVLAALQAIEAAC